MGDLITSAYHEIQETTLVEKSERCWQAGNVCSSAGQTQPLSSL